MKLNNSWKLIISIIVVQLAGIIGSLFTTPSIPNWYADLIKPTLIPPSWVFGPVWTTLFLLMGIALFLIWIQHFNILKNIEMLKTWRAAMTLFFGQLILNMFWSVIFFGWHSPGWALVEITILWLTILATIIFFAKISKTAAWLLVPYLVWTAFAIYLNYSIWLLNL